LWNIDPPDFQPKIWTAISFEGSAAQADEIADKLFKNYITRVVCQLFIAGGYLRHFPQKIFKYCKGDQLARNEAQQFGRDMGIPEPQLDWGE
jgi:hypothetical protein